MREGGRHDSGELYQIMSGPRGKSVPDRAAGPARRRRYATLFGCLKAVLERLHFSIQPLGKVAAEPGEVLFD